jgi:hypothetical protein
VVDVQFAIGVADRALLHLVVELIFELIAFTVDALDERLNLFVVEALGPRRRSDHERRAERRGRRDGESCREQDLHHHVLLAGQLPGRRGPRRELRVVRRVGGLAEKETTVAALAELWAGPRSAREACL